MASILHRTHKSVVAGFVINLINKQACPSGSLEFGNITSDVSQFA